MGITQAVLMDGKSLASEIKAEIAQEVKTLGIRPKLAVVLVGEDPASKVYISKKREACAQVGFHSELHEFSADTPEDELVELINDISTHRTLNVDGILVQLPLPAHYNRNRILNAVSPDKDVDCFNTANVGKLVQGDAVFKPCTPSGILALLKKYEISLKGKNIVIINRSMVVGMPLAQMLSQEGVDATVTICHEHSDTEHHASQADIIVTAVGKASSYQLPPRWIKPGAVVIDVGINRGSAKKLMGDVLDFEGACQRASYITPVPGGVGPLTVAFLLKNTLTAAKLKRGIK